MKEKFEREIGVSKFVGMTPEEEDAAAEEAKKIFENQGENKKLFVKVNGIDLGFDVKDLEREKTPEEREIIAMILEKMPDFIRRYGGSPVELSQEHIHVFSQKIFGPKFEEYIAKNKKTGHYYPDQQYAGVWGRENLLDFALVAAHEILHFNSFQSRENNFNGRSKTRSRRTGFTVHSYVTGPVEDYFFRINEPLTEELTKRFAEEYFGEFPLLAQEVAKKERLKKEIIEKHPDKKWLADEISFISGETDTIEGNANTAKYSYFEDRARMKNYFKELYEKNPEEFGSEEKVFELFARAAMSGNLMPAARLIEKTYGKGSFRFLGEQSKEM